MVSRDTTNVLSSWNGIFSASVDCCTFSIPLSRLHVIVPLCSPLTLVERMRSLTVSAKWRRCWIFSRNWWYFCENCMWFCEKLHIWQPCSIFSLRLCEIYWPTVSTVFCSSVFYISVRSIGPVEPMRSTERSIGVLLFASLRDLSQSTVAHDIHRDAPEINRDDFRSQFPGLIFTGWMVPTTTNTYIFLHRVLQYSSIYFLLILYKYIYSTPWR